MTIAFVLGGGGHLGAHEVGMLKALVERDIRPDLIIGTSIGAINGAMVAADPTPAAVDQLAEIWTGHPGHRRLRRLGLLPAADPRPHPHRRSPATPPSSGCCTST